jgi:uncharacterized protein YjiS (DUF1127 family)
MAYFPNAPITEAGIGWGRFLLERIRRIVTAGQTRQSLDALDPRTLRDIGLTRQEVVFARVNRR